ncbi:S1C family serine protease [Planococcus sp. CAU13]|uniref:S1C family serine protease n=1 Tax=Planococcus sp. CAU13 TaxID=1541197 RepID=UPI00068CC6DC|nr:trypsin-like peptidase domain-containing protein [Planococcus sp. CAU13]
MNTRIDNKKNKSTRVKAVLVSVLFFAVLAIALAVYFPGNDDNAEAIRESLEKTSFEGRGYNNQIVLEVPQGIASEEAVQPEGVVTDLTNSGEELETVVEKELPTEPVDEGPKVEPVNLETLIANSKSAVYTIYTDSDQGSGFLFNQKGDIVTNAHVVDGSSFVTVMSSDGEFYDGRIVGISETTDIALIRVDGLKGKKPLGMELSEVPVHTPVFTLGSPGNVNNTSTIGEITSIGKSFSDVYQYDNLYEMSAEIKLGSSGGPLISSLTGRVLGINSIVLTENPKIGYAIPLHQVNDQLEQWAAKDIPVEQDGAEVVVPEIQEVELTEELLRSFMRDFYDLIAPSLEYQEGKFYKFFLLAGTQAETAVVEMVEAMKTEDRTFQSVESNITDVQIYDFSADVAVSAKFTFVDKTDGTLVTINHEYIYEVVIDQYGDYQIQSIRNKE